MDENNNQDIDIYEDENLEKVKKAGKDAVKKGIRELGKEAKKAMKELFKKLLALIPPYVWLIIAGVILLIVLLATFWWAITEGTYNSISDIAKSTTTDNSGNIKNITVIDEENRQLKIDSESFLKDVDQWFKINNISPSTLGLDNKEYSSLVTFLEAETVSSFPDLRERNKIGTPVSKDELQGIVQFKRKYEDGTEQLLEYKKYTEFRKELAKLGKKLDEKETQEQIYFKKEEVEKAYNNLKTYFTLDDNFNLIIVSLVTNEHKVTYSSYAKEENDEEQETQRKNEDEYSYEFYVNVSKINYQSIIQKYTMPFEFPLALLVTTRNPEFCEEVAKLAMLSQEGDKSIGVTFEPKIIIDIQDNITSTYIKEDYSYIANFKLQDYVTYKIVQKDEKGKIIHIESGLKADPYPAEVEKTVPVDSYKVTENWMSTITPQLCVSEAITWIIDYTSTYNKIEDSKLDLENVKEEDEEEYIKVSDYHDYLKNQNFQYTTETEEIYENEFRQILEKKTNKNTKITTITDTTKYNKTNSEIEPKWERFLSLLKIEKKDGIFNLEDTKKNDTYIKYKLNSSSSEVSPEKNLLSAETALYTLLASNSKTVALEEIMKNLMNIYTRRTTVNDVEFDFSIYKPSDFITFMNGGTSGIDGVQGQIYDFLLSKGMSSIGAAAILGNMEQESSFNTAASNGTHFGLCQWGGGRWKALQNFAISSSWTDLNVQLEYLWYELEGTYSDVKDALMNATDLQSAVNYFCRNFEICGNYNIEVPKRYQYALKWYQSWNENHSNELDGGDGVNSIISWAVSQVGKSRFYSKYRGGYVESDGYCAAFVKSAYYEAGLGYIDGNAIDIPHSNTIRYNTAGKVDYSTIPIGACIVSSGTSSYGHVALYIGNGYVVEAGGSTIVKNQIDNSYGKGKFLGWGYAIN